MLDVVCVAMVAVIPLMAYGIKLAKQRKYQKHKTVMIVLCATLFTTVVAFEGDISFLKITKWRDCLVLALLCEWACDEVFDRPSLLFSAVVIALDCVDHACAMKLFPNPPVPNHHSRWHRRYGMIGAYLMTGTAVTGWIFLLLGLRGELENRSRISWS